MKIVISGGLGYVGGKLSEYMALRGHTVVALSRKVEQLDELALPQGLSIAHPDSMLGRPSALEGCDIFIHLASLNEIDCVKFPEQAIEVNITQSRQWLETARQANIRKFIYFSTAHVYDKPLNGSYDESTLTRPLHPYSITHKCAEDYVSMYGSDFGMDNIILRLTNSFGGTAFPTADRWTLLVNDLCRSAVRTGVMTLMSDGMQLRDFITLADVCRAVEHLNTVHKPHMGNVYNLALGKSRTVWDLACATHAIAESFLNKKIELTRKAPGSEKPGALRISNDKLIATGFRIENNVEEAVVSTLEYFTRFPHL